MEYIALARYQFTFRVTAPIRLQDYAGSALRGAFGHALKQLACVTRAKECKGCDLIASCPYPKIFSPHDIPRSDIAFSTLQQIPVPYIVEPPAWGERNYAEDDEFQFSMVLMGDAIDQLPLIILAWRRAFLRGIGKTEGKADLLRVDYLPHGNHQDIQTIYADEQPVLIQHSAQLAIPVIEQPQDFHLHVTTPLRIEKEKKALGARDITASIFLRHLIRRISLVEQFCFADNQTQYDREKISKLNTQADNVTDERRLAWRDWSRYSTRQQQKMTLGGVTGHWLLNQVTPDLYRYLYLGQWLHAGKETAFGLGHYTILESVWQPRESSSQDLTNVSV